MPSIFSVCFQRLGIFGPCNHEIKNTHTHTHTNISCAPEPTQSRCTYYTLFFQIRCLGPERVQDRYQGLPKYQGLSKLDRSFKRCLRWKHAWLPRAEVFTLHTSGHFHTSPTRSSPSSPARSHVVGVHTTLTQDGQPHTPHRPCGVPRAVPKNPRHQPKNHFSHNQAPSPRITPQLSGLTRSATCGRGAHKLNAGRAAPHTSPSVRRTSCRAGKRAL
jgi:hypothetical protein